jgi:hypothetical protein
MQENKLSLQELLHPEGVFNPGLRFAFTNITEEEFLSAWDGNPIKIGVGRTVELPHHLAVKLTKELVDKIMIGEAALDKATNGVKDPYYRSPKGGMLGVPSAREVWEVKICRLLEDDEESPEKQFMRMQLKEELRNDLEAGQKPADRNIPIPSGVEEFADLTAKPEKKRGRPVKLKEI